MLSVKKISNRINKIKHYPTGCGFVKININKVNIFCCCFVNKMFSPPDQSFTRFLIFFYHTSIHPHYTKIVMFEFVSDNRMNS